MRSGRLEKSQEFGSWKYVGDVLNAIKIFNEKDVDEVVVLDVDATREHRGPDFAMLEQVASECFMPMAYGGGIYSADVARQVMDRGIEKVVLNSAAWKRPQLVTEVAAILGSSSTVVSLDATTNRRGLVRYDHRAGRTVKKENLEQRLAELVAAGAGEILLQSTDRDGTLAGPDLALVDAVTADTSVPIVYAGGVSSLADAEALWRRGVSGVAVGAWFVFRGPHRAVVISYPPYDLIAESFSRIGRSG